MLWDRGCIEQAIEPYVGVVSAEVNAGAELIVEADVILTIGARVDYRLSFGEPPIVGKDTLFIRVDADPQEVNRGVTPEIGIVGNPRIVLEQLTEQARQKSWDNEAWLRRIRKHRAAETEYWAAQDTPDKAPLLSLRLCREIKPFLDRDISFLLDGGNIGRWAHMHFFDRHPSHWFTCGISGVVGWGIPGAVAIKLARPDKPVLLLSGDGAGGFTLGDIQTAVRFGTPYVAVVAHDAAWGIVTDEQPEGKHAGSDLGEIRFDRVAQALGAKGVYVSEASQIAPAIEEGLTDNVPTFIHVPTLTYGIENYKKRIEVGP